MLIELSCMDIHCTPCTYPNCQRFVREKLAKKKPVVGKVTEITPEEYRKFKRTV